MPCRRPPVGRRARSTVDRRGLEPRSPVCRTGVLPVRPAARRHQLSRASWSRSDRLRLAREGLRGVAWTPPRGKARWPRGTRSGSTLTSRVIPREAGAASTCMGRPPQGWTKRRSDPGWIRTSDLRDVNAASTPLLHRIVPSRAGRSRTCLAPLIRRRPRRSVHGPIRSDGAQGVEPRPPGSEPGRLPLQHTPGHSARRDVTVTMREASP
jgi:hypothetical protein